MSANHQEPPALKAYTVYGDDEGSAVVIFAKTGAEARRRGAAEFGCDFGSVESCRRAPEFDAYAAAGRVPIMVLLDHGWWQECGYCGHMINSGREGPDGEELSPVEYDGALYCDHGHMMAELRAQKIRQDKGHAAIEACATTFSHLPIFDLRGALYCSVGGRDRVMCCEFDFPGRKGRMARWDVGERGVQISACDQAAWAEMVHKAASSCTR